MVIITLEEFVLNKFFTIYIIYTQTVKGNIKYLIKKVGIILKKDYKQE